MDFEESAHVRLGPALGRGTVYPGRPPGGEAVSDREALVSLGLEFLHGTDRVARKVVSMGGFRREEVVADQLFEGSRYLGVGATLKGIAEVFAVDLAVTQKGAEARVEDAGCGGEGEGPDLRLVPEVADPRGVAWAFSARVVKTRYLGKLLSH